MKLVKLKEYTEMMVMICEHGRVLRLMAGIGNSEWDWIINSNIILLSWASKNQLKFSVARKSEKKLLVNVGILSISTTKNSKVC